MSVAVLIRDGPLAERPPELPLQQDGAVGARIVFEGIVRRREDDADIEALDYEVYEPMASRELRQLGETALRDFGLFAVVVEHSRGRVPVGRPSFRLCIASCHRKEGLSAMDWFIDRLKEDVPIWKSVAGSQTG